MFSKQKTKITYVIIALIGLIALLYIFKPKSEFEACYDKCIRSLPEKCYISNFDKVYRSLYSEASPTESCINKENYCIRVCANTK